MQCGLPMLTHVTFHVFPSTSSPAPTTPPSALVGCNVVGTSGADRVGGPMSTATYKHVCMYVGMWVRVILCMWVWIWVCEYVGMYVCEYVYEYVCGHVCVWTYVCIYVRMYVCANVFLHVWMFVCMYALCGLHMSCVYLSAYLYLYLAYLYADLCSSSCCTSACHNICHMYTPSHMRARRLQTGTCTLIWFSFLIVTCPSSLRFKTMMPARVCTE